LNQETVKPHNERPDAGPRPEIRNTKLEILKSIYTDRRPSPLLPRPSSAICLLSYLRGHRLMVEESFELSGSDGVLELSYRLCLNLPDALTSNFEDSADLFEGIGIAVPDSVSQLYNLAFAI